MSDLQAPQQESGTSAADRLQDALSLASRGEYGTALQKVRSVKAVQPENIYLLAFERQIEQLKELSDAGAITDEQRQDILESIPGIVERAIEQPNTRPSDMASTGRASSDITTEERSAALSWLKNQYFQHAHDYVQKGQFSHALTEIQRVFIIDPGNSSARDFEQKIHKLLGMTQPGEGSEGAGGAVIRKDSNVWLVVAAALFILVTILVIYFLNK